MLQLILKDDFIYYDTSKNICSTFYVKANDTAFPDDKWYDLPISVFTIWNENIIKYNNKKRCEFKLFFMDGPFYIECQKEGNNVLMRFINNKISPIEKYTFETTFSDLKNSVYNGATQLVNLISQKEIGNLSGLDKLKQTTDTLKDLIKK